MSEWRDVPQFAITYEVSDDGRIDRICTYGRNPEHVRTPVILTKKPNGYVEVEIHRDKHRHRRYVHQLVWEAFRGPIPSGLDVNHRDGNKANNRLDNLELMTRSENMLHMFQNLNPSLRRAHGTAHGRAKLTEDEVREILKLSHHGKSHSQIAKIYGVSSTAIAHIFMGKNWKHVTGFDFNQFGNNQS